MQAWATITINFANESFYLTTLHVNLAGKDSPAYHSELHQQVTCSQEMIDEIFKDLPDVLVLWMIF